MVEETNYLASEVNRWLSDALRNENFKTINAELTGTSKKGDGYVGDIAFVKVTALTFNEKNKEYNLVLKYGKQTEGLREKMPVRQAFEREIFVYNKVVPTFQRFEDEKGVKLLDTFLAKCFGTLVYDTQEVIILQNLKTLHYDLHDRFKPLDINHLTLTFTNYGRWHALSLAYRDQNPNQFNKLFNNLDCVTSMFLREMHNTLRKMEKNVYDILESKREFDLVKRLREKMPKGFLEIFLDLVATKEPNSVFYHADCWNNNFMFKYHERDSTCPESAVFLDFQTSKLASPIMDLSYHLYSTASEKELLQFKELLQTYYSSLSTTLTSLGSDPEKVFPYSELVRQWKKYSSYGVISASLVLPIALSNGDDIRDAQDVIGERVTELLKNVRQKNDGLISPRIIAMVKHFTDFDDF